MCVCVRKANKAVKSKLRNPWLTLRQHKDTSGHLLYNVVWSEKIQVVHVSSAKQHVDVLTKTRKVFPGKQSLSHESARKMVIFAREMLVFVFVILELNVVF